MKKHLVRVDTFDKLCGVSPVVVRSYGDGIMEIEEFESLHEYNHGNVCQKCIGVYNTLQKEGQCETKTKNI